MNYELAKKLKEAGFKQTLVIGKHYYCNEKLLEFNGVIESNVDAVVPTLAELIEACRKIQGLLIMSIDIGYVGVNLNGVNANGSTPEEAVANLWLKLNDNTK